MTEGKHQKLATRLGEILRRLNDGERLTINKLADEFDVDARTIRRDLRERLVFVDWVEEGPYYSINKGKYGHLSDDDLSRLANFLCVQGLFPQVDRDFFLTHLKNSVLVKGVNYEDIRERLSEFDALAKAIKANQITQFVYTKVNGLERKSYCVHPYHLVNKSGIWYLIALDNGKRKTFCFSQINQLELLDEWFQPDSNLLAEIQESDSISYGNQFSEIVLRVNASVAMYFQRRALLPNQEITQTFDDGALLITCKDVNPMEVVPVVQYWLPHMQIVSPIELQTKLKQMLKQYLAN